MQFVVGHLIAIFVCQPKTRKPEPEIGNAGFVRTGVFLGGKGEQGIGNRSRRPQREIQLADLQRPSLACY